MVWSNLIAAFIIIAAAATIFGKTGELQSVQQAASVLKPFAGNLAYLFFTIGIIFSGFLAIPVLIGSTSYAFAEIFGFKEGFNKKPNRAKQFYIIVSICAAVGALIALLPVNPIKFLFYTQVLDGLLMPFLVVVLIALCNNKKIMGAFVNTKWKNFVAVALTAILSVLDVFLIIEFVKMI
jgi:Mn2+/Fe2+ NRAMP family transporter